ncbi:DUF4384 domain-containing protein [candidate division KSB3 bacterium]|uniref:DUF4384 domain-containing protein n=1 Tax=candidate division KSB3 bacterium TaxID=2044937 RepID=A0A9D5K082_9BACT|nr:DUF4384 domain-containing protein [candidate division KSB3 bacterium]MBD3327245.1 DUF4384 domain-containing protein [candidate division KSB3 bacterium]
MQEKGAWCMMRNTSRRGLQLIILCLGIGCLFAEASLAQQRPERPKTPVPPPSPGVVASEEDVGIKVWTDKGDNAPTYYVGERIYISFTVQNDSYVTIYDVDSTGNVNVLFPNPYHRDNLVRKGRVYTIPTSNYEYDLVVKGPTGDEVLFAIASSHIYYHWQYCTGCPPPIWSDQWGVPSTWGHPGGPDPSVTSRRFQKRLQMQPQLADLTINYIKHHIELAKPLTVKSSECRFYVTVSPYEY